MKLLYISNRSHFNIGANVHMRALKEIVGEDNFFKVDFFVEENPVRTTNYIAYGKYKTKIERIRRWAQGNNMYVSREIIDEICSLIDKEKIQVVFSEEGFAGSIFKEIKDRNKNIKIICFYHDIGADLYRQWRKNNKSLTSFIENTINLHQEKIGIKYSDFRIVFHESDKEKMQYYYGVIPNKILPLSTIDPGIPDKDQVINGTSSEKKEILFVGSSYYPNIKGIKWFYEKIMPQIDNKKCVLNIVGRGTETLKTYLNSDNVNIVGGVESVESYYRNADIVIAPIFDGGGMKAKSIEAVSYAKCFVGTDNSLAGFWEQMDASVKNVIVFNCNDETEWTDTINSLMKKDIHKFNPELYKVFLDRFSYESTKKELCQILEEIEK